MSFDIICVPEQLVSGTLVNLNKYEKALQNLTFWFHVVQMLSRN